jgi:tyrosine-protein phosphatase SIW14
VATGVHARGPGWRRRPLPHVSILGVMFAIVCLAIAEQKATDTDTSSSPVGARRINEAGLPNFGEVTPRLYRGGQPTRVGYEKLAKMGVDMVIDLRLTKKGEESREVKKVGMEYVSIPWHCYLPRDAQFARFLTILRDNPHKKIYVHCRYGDDRTGMMIAAYRMAVEGWTPTQARKEMEKFGFHRLICPSLGPYEKSFPERLKKHSAFETLRSDRK